MKRRALSWPTTGTGGPGNPARGSEAGFASFKEFQRSIIKSSPCIITFNSVGWKALGKSRCLPIAVSPSPLSLLAPRLAAVSRLRSSRFPAPRGQYGPHKSAWISSDVPRFYFSSISLRLRGAAGKAGLRLGNIEGRKRREGDGWRRRATEGSINTETVDKPGEHAAASKSRGGLKPGSEMMLRLRLAMLYL